MKEMKIFASIFLAILGITAFSKNESEVFALTDEQKASIEKEGYKMSMIEKFNAALAHTPVTYEAIGFTEFLMASLVISTR